MWLTSTDVHRHVGGLRVDQYRALLTATCTPTTCQLHMAENSFTRTTYVSPFKANRLLQRIGMQSLVRYGADVTLLSTVAT